MSEEQLTKKERKALKKQEQEEHRQAEAEAKRALKTKRLTVITISAIVIFAFLFWLVQNAPERAEIPRVAYTQDETPAVINEVTVEDNTKGAENPLVTIVEYSDFQCPACAAYATPVKNLIESNPQLQLVYRNFPLVIHRNAFLAASYAEAAGMQGKFFEMHDILFANQTEWDGLTPEGVQDTFVAYAESLGLDGEQLRTDALSEKVQTKVNGHYSDGVDAGVEWTPTFYVNGVRVDDNSQLQVIVANELAKGVEAPGPGIDVGAIQDALESAEGSETEE